MKEYEKIISYVLAACLASIVGALILEGQLLLLSIVIAGMLMYLALRRVQWMLNLTIFTVAFVGVIIEFVPKHIFVGRTLIPSDIFLIYLGAGLLIHVLANNKVGTLLKKVDKSVIFFALVVIYGFIYGILSGYDEVFRASRGQLFYALLPLFIAFLYDREESSMDKKSFIKFLFIYFITVNVISIMLSVGMLDFLMGTKRVSQVFGFLRPNLLVDTVLSIPSIFFGIFALYYLNGKRVIILSSACIILGLACLMITVTRGFLIAFILTAMFLPFVLKEDRFITPKMLILLLVSIVSLIILMDYIEFDFIEAYKFRFQSMETIESRIGESKDFINSISEKPMFGHGFGAPVIRNHSLGYMRFYETAYSHNDYLYFLQTVGIVGFAVFIWFVLKSILTAIRTIRQSKGGCDAIIPSLTLTLLISYVMISFAAPEFRNLSSTPLLLALIGFTHCINVELRDPSAC